MARRQYCRPQVFLILALLSLYISSTPVQITARTEKQTEFETKGYGLNQINHPRHIETGQKRRVLKRRMMKVEELNDYPGSGANNRHTPCSDC